MDQYPSENPRLPVSRPRHGTLSGAADVAPLIAAQRFHEPLRFPGEDGGRSLQEMAQRDLDATLQLLAERAHYITGASGAAIALGHSQEMLCRASCGPCAPKVGSPLRANSGLSGESVRTRQILCCSNTAEDPRVDPDSCRELGIACAMVMPLLRRDQVVGIFELFSSRAHAFEERDLLALQRLGEMILTAIDHAEAARDVQSLIAAAGASPSQSHGNSPLSEALLSEDHLGEGSETSSALLVERGQIGGCALCGFPVSHGRTLCLDCENSRKPQAAAQDSSRSRSTVKSHATHSEADEASWWQSHKYLVGTVLVAALAVSALILLR